MASATWEYLWLFSPVFRVQTGENFAASIHPHAEGFRLSEKLLLVFFVCLFHSAGHWGEDLCVTAKAVLGFGSLSRAAARHELKNNSQEFTRLDLRRKGSFSSG